MNASRIGGLFLSGAAAMLLSAAAAPAAQSSPKLPIGPVAGFTGCLTQESGVPGYFDLKNAKTDDGKNVGTLRLTGSITGITPKESLQREVHVNAMYRGRGVNEPAGMAGHASVDSASIVGAQCT